jgi:hypothetical protein
MNPNATFNDSGINIKSLDVENGHVKDIEIAEERDYIILRLQLDIKKDQTSISKDGWVEVNTKDFKSALKIAKKILGNQFSKFKQQKNNLKLMGTYQMIITGSERDYWNKSEIDIHKFKIDMNGVAQPFKNGDFEEESNIEIFNKEVFDSKLIRGDTLGNLKLPTTIYGLGNNLIKDIHELPRAYLLNLTVSTKNKDKELIKIQNKQFKFTINTIISNFGMLLAYLGKLTDLYQNEFSIIHRKSNEIREKALRLQIKINNFLVKKSDKSKQSSSELKDSLGKDDEEDSNQPYYGWEEKLLLKASRYFSLLTEINQLLARVNYLRNDASMNIEKLTTTFGLTQITYMGETNKEIPSLGLEFKHFSEAVSYNFQNLKVELDHSQTTIRNTVDILKTFLESEQRIVSQKVGELFNWIVIVFAGLGLADALGNFVIFVLEGGSVYDAMFWFFIILTVLFMVIVIMYFWLFKKPKQLSALR